MATKLQGLSKWGRVITIRPRKDQVLTRRQLNQRNRYLAQGKLPI